MSWKESVLQAIKGLRGWMQVADVSDPEVIVGVGTSLEAGFSKVPEGETLAAVSHQMLLRLQAIYQGQVDDAPQAMLDLAKSVEIAQSYLEGTVTEDGLSEAMALSGGDGAASDDAPAGQPASDDDAPAPAGDSAPALGTHLEQLAGRVVAMDPGDTDNLQALHEQLLTTAAREGLALEVTEPIGVAAAQLDMILKGVAPDDGDAMDLAAEQLQVAAAAAPAEAEVLAEELPQSAQDQPGAAEADDDPPLTEEPPAEAPAVEDPQVEQPAEEAPPERPAEEAPPAKVEAPAFEGEAILAEDTDLDLLKDFIVECLDHINMAEAALLELESNPDNLDQISVVFRAFHTIKGTSGFLDLQRIQRCAHLAENLLDRARDGELRMIGGYADLALQSSDALKMMISELDGLAPGSPTPVPENFDELLAVLSDPEAAGVSEEEDTQPMRVGDILVGKGAASRDDVERAAENQGSTPIGRKLVEDRKTQPKDVVDAVRTQKKMSGSTTESSVRVGTDRLDSLINMVGELVIAQSMVQQDPTVTEGEGGRLARNVSHAGKIIRELQDLTMSLRMVPLKATFQKMARLVRDVSRKAGKQVQFVTEGEDTEIDRTMVETLGDPLIHMMRNSCDHGVETAEDRVAAGKDPTGTVTLRAYHAAGNVVIEIADDGKGLDREKILAKAVERGLVDANKAKDLPDNEVFGMIFQPGFSTADQVTDVSGRGVGMDVVRKNIESVRGRIEVSSKQGRGTTVTLRLPLTMAIADAMLLRVGEQRYLLPTITIEQSFRPEPGMVTTVTGQGEQVLLRGELLPVFRLNELFDIPESCSDPTEGLLIIIEGEGRRCALMVDEILGQQQVVIKSLGQALGTIAGVSGGAILGDGQVGLILDSTGILKLANQRGRSPASAA
ncbi:MAG: chemotaxis protein CheW [Phycisphaerae bacterium]